MTRVTLFAEFRGRRYLMEDKYARFPDAEHAGFLMGKTFPRAAFYVTDRDIPCDGGDAIAFAQEYEARFPVATRGEG